MSKLCNRCKVAGEFYKRGDGGGGFRSICIACWSAAMSARPSDRKIPLLTAEEKKEHTKANLKRYRATPEYKAKHAYDMALKRAHKAKATPKWLTEKQLEHIKAYYETAQMLSDRWGIQMDVDHEIPLHGKNVSGLHVPWNICIMEHMENVRKNNSHEV